MGKMVRAGAEAGIFYKLEPKPEQEPDKNGPAPQHYLFKYKRMSLHMF
jgi:hypothetical protein